jgi:hypothetical protein
VNCHRYLYNICTLCMLACWLFLVHGPQGRSPKLGAIVTVTRVCGYHPPSGKNKIASSASGCIRRTRRFGRNLLNSDALGTAPCVCMQLASAQCDLTQLPCHMLTGRGVAEYFPFGRSRVRAFSFWTQPCQCKSRPGDACHGITVTPAVKALNIITQLIPNIVTQSDCISYM